jgi:hypothetical protein
MPELYVNTRVVAEKPWMECGGKRSATPLWFHGARNAKEIQSAANVGALQICYFWTFTNFFSNLPGGHC